MWSDFFSPLGSKIFLKVTAWFPHNFRIFRIFSAQTPHIFLYFFPWLHNSLPKAQAHELCCFHPGRLCERGRKTPWNGVPGLKYAIFGKSKFLQGIEPNLLYPIFALGVGFKVGVCFILYLLYARAGHTNCPSVFCSTFLRPNPPESPSLARELL